MTRRLDRGFWGVNGGIWAAMNMGGCVYEYEGALYVNVIYYPSVPTLCIRGIPGNPRTPGNDGRLPEICLEAVLGCLVRRIPFLYREWRVAVSQEGMINKQERSTMPCMRL